MRKRRKFTPDFKAEAVRLVNESGKSVTQVARELGIRVDLLHTWKRRLAEREDLALGDVFPGNGNVSSDAEEIRRLRRELERVTQERDFLKKAAAYFAKESR